MARANSFIEMMQPGMIPFSSLCHSDVVDPNVTLKLKLFLLVQYEISDLAWDVVPIQSHINQLVGE